MKPAVNAAPKRVAELGVIVRAHHLLIGVPARYVDRLVLPHEVREVRVGAPGVVEAAGRSYAAWDLGVLLGLPLLSSAWVLARAPRPSGDEVRVALRTGPCVVVERLPALTPIPAGAQTTRRGALAGGFAAHDARGDAIFGLVLDLSRLFHPRELAACSPPSGRLDEAIG